MNPHAARFQVMSENLRAAGSARRHFTMSAEQQALLLGRQLLGDAPDMAIAIYHSVPVEKIRAARAALRKGSIAGPEGAEFHSQLVADMLVYGPEDVEGWA